MVNCYWLFVNWCRTPIKSPIELLNLHESIMQIWNSNVLNLIVRQHK